jgi:hypothetical protein
LATNTWATPFRPVLSAYPWLSPTKVSQTGTNTILADANHWGNDGSIAIPHTKSGSIKQNGNCYYYGTPGKMPADYGAQEETWRTRRLSHLENDEANAHEPGFLLRLLLG